MPLFLIVFLVGFIIQLIKVILDSIDQKHFSLSQLFSSGGFPSFHSGIASSVTMITLLHEGVGGTTFAIALTFSVLFAYDAMNIRFQTGKHAEYLNKLGKDFQKTIQENNMEAPRWISTYKKTKLRERLGHTPFEVFWGILFGIVLTFVFYYVFYV